MPRPQSGDCKNRKNCKPDKTLKIQLLTHKYKEIEVFHLPLGKFDSSKDMSMSHCSSSHTNSKVVSFRSSAVLRVDVTRKFVLGIAAEKEHVQHINIALKVLSSNINGQVPPHQVD